jgi:hypothetical protein
VSTLGPPPSCMLRNVRKACKFFSLNHLTYQWILKSPQQLKAESGIVSKETRKYIFHSLSDLTRLSSHGSNKHKSLVEQLDCLQFVSLLASMLTFDPSRRNLPSQALQSPFVTMHHLAAHTSDSSVRDWIQCMHVCCMSRTTNSSPPTTQLHPSLPPQAQPHPPHPFPASSLLGPLSHPVLVPHPPLLTTVPHPPLTYHLSPMPSLPHPALPLRQKSSLVSTVCEDTGYASAESSPITSRQHMEHMDMAHVLIHTPQLTPSQSSLPHLLTTSQQQLYSLYMAQYMSHTHLHTPSHTHTLTSSAPVHPFTPSTSHLHNGTLHTLAPHHPFSRL